MHLEQAIIKYSFTATIKTEQRQLFLLYRLLLYCRDSCICMEITLWCVFCSVLFTGNWWKLTTNYSLETPNSRHWHVWVQNTLLMLLFACDLLRLGQTHIWPVGRATSPVDIGTGTCLQGWDDMAKQEQERFCASLGLFSSPSLSSGAATYPKVNFLSLGSDTGSFIPNSQLY